MHSHGVAYSQLSNVLDTIQRPDATATSVNSLLQHNQTRLRCVPFTGPDTVSNLLGGKHTMLPIQRVHHGSCQGGRPPGFRPNDMRRHIGKYFITWPAVHQYGYLIAHDARRQENGSLL